MRHGIPFWGFLSESGHGESLGEGLEVVMRVGFPKPPHSPPRVPQITQTQILSENFQARFSKRDPESSGNPATSRTWRIRVCGGDPPRPPRSRRRNCLRGTGRPALQGAAAGRGCRGDVGSRPRPPGAFRGCRSILGALGTPRPPAGLLRIRNLHAIPQLRRTKGALQGGRTPDPPRVPLQGP